MTLTGQHRGGGGGDEDEECLRASAAGEDPDLVSSGFICPFGGFSVHRCKDSLSFKTDAQREEE